ncbi:MAG: hypothetical protein DRP78_07190, partial [Candidatus Omnitrophota bacterium]
KDEKIAKYLFRFIIQAGDLTNTPEHLRAGKSSDGNIDLSKIFSPILFNQYKNNEKFYLFLRNFSGVWQEELIWTKNFLELKRTLDLVD